jgi:hypothetical protein
VTKRQLGEEKERIMNKGAVAFSLAIMALGAGWLLTAKGVGEGIDWVWTIGLGVMGLIVFLVSGGFDKLSVVVGPMFMIASAMSLLRQSGRIAVNTEAPTLVIAFGAAMLLAQAPFIPYPKWYQADTRKPGA